MKILDTFKNGMGLSMVFFCLAIISLLASATGVSAETVDKTVAKQKMEQGLTSKEQVFLALSLPS